MWASLLQGHHRSKHAHFPVRTARGKGSVPKAWSSWDCFNREEFTCREAFGWLFFLLGNQMSSRPGISEVTAEVKKTIVF